MGWVDNFDDNQKRQVFTVLVFLAGGCILIALFPLIAWILAIIFILLGVWVGKSLFGRKSERKRFKQAFKGGFG